MAMNAHLGVAEVKQHISNIINRVAYGGERIIITSRGKPKAAIISMDDLRLLEVADHELRERRASAWGWLARIDELRERIGARVGGELPDSTQLLREIREGRDDEILGLR